MDLIARVLGKLRGASFLKGEGGTVVCAARRGLGGSFADVATCWSGGPALTAQDRPRLPLDFEARSWLRLDPCRNRPARPALASTLLRGALPYQ